MNFNENEQKYLDYLEGHIANVKEAFDLLCTLDIPFINENKSKLSTLISNHDSSKYEEPEWTGYLHHWYPVNDEDKLKTEEYEESCRHHIKNNPHHWDYWVDEENNLIDDIDELEYKLYTVERVCDHMAMSIQNENKPSEWYFANKDHIVMPQYGYDLYEEILNKIPEDYDLSFHGTRSEGKPERDTVNESASSIICYRSIGKEELSKLLNGETIYGQFDNSSERQNNSSEKDVVGFFTKPYAWRDKYHIFTIKCKLNPNELSYGNGVYYASKDLDKTKVWTGRRGKQEYNLDEVYAKSYNIDDVISFISVDGKDPFDIFNNETSKEFNNILKSKGIPIENLNSLNESVLLEAKAAQLKNKTKSEDPARVKKAKNVKTSYIGMSKFGILNFKTSSESRSGHHYQTIEFHSLKPFEELIKKNGKITPDDVKKNLNDQDINVYCSDESFSYWSWYHQAYQNDYAFIDDNISNLDKRLSAPKVNNVRLAGALCKHLYSVLEYVTRPFVLLAISDDMNNFLNNKEHKYAKQTTATQNWYDAVKQWTDEDAQDYLGLTREQIIMDLSKTVKIDNEIDLETYVDDLVREAIKANKDKEDPKLVKEITDKVIAELNLEDEFNKMKPEEEVISDEENSE